MTFRYPLKLLLVILACNGCRKSDYHFKCNNGDVIDGRITDLPDYDGSTETGKSLKAPCKDIGYAFFIDNNNARFDFYGKNCNNNVYSFLKANSFLLKNDTLLPSEFKLGLQKVDQNTGLCQLVVSDWRKWF